MSRRFPSALKSSFATFGYEADGFIMSMVDVVGVVNDDSTVPVGEACIIGDSPTGIFATLSPGTVAFHRSDPDVWDFMTPWEVRTVFDKGSDVIKVWNPSVGRYAWRTATASSSDAVLPLGIEGQVLYNLASGTTGYSPDHLLKVATIVIDEDELAEKLTDVVTLQTIYNSWQRISHSRSGVYPASASEMNSWQYVNDTIKSATNSLTYLGFVSLKLYDKYTFDVTVKSASSDDDLITMIVAFNKLPTGEEHTLSAVRTAGMKGFYSGMAGFSGVFYRWALVYDLGQKTERILINKSDGFSPAVGWSARPAGCRIVCDRDMTVIRLQTSQLNSLTLDPIGDITFDLLSDPDTQQFAPACAMGLGCLSQASTTYVINELMDSDLIIDVRDNTIYVYNFSSQTWELSTLTVDDRVGIGRFIWSDYRERLYYNFGDGVLKKLSSKNLIQVD